MAQFKQDLKHICLSPYINMPSRFFFELLSLLLWIQVIASIDISCSPTLDPSLPTSLHLFWPSQIVRLSFPCEISWNAPLNLSHKVVLEKWRQADMIWALWVQIYWYGCAVTEHGGTHGRLAGMGQWHTHACTYMRTHTHTPTHTQSFCLIRDVVEIKPEVVYCFEIVWLSTFMYFFLIISSSF